MTVRRVRLDRRWSRAPAGLVLGLAALFGLLALVSASADIGDSGSEPAPAPNSPRGLRLLQPLLP
jgi:hypothetical protein